MKSVRVCGTVVAMRGVVVFLVLAALTAGCESSEGESEARLPAPITLEGVGGVETLMAASDVRRTWDVPLPVLEEWGSSTFYEYAAICEGGMAGAAFFVNDQLRALVFFRGARTDRDVGIGSTLDELRAAYGSRLVRRDDHFDGQPAWRLVAQHGEQPRDAIQFNMNEGKVRAVLWGLSDALAADYSFGPSLYINQVFC